MASSIGDGANPHSVNAVNQQHPLKGDNRSSGLVLEPQLPSSHGAPVNVAPQVAAQINVGMQKIANQSVAGDRANVGEDHVAIAFEFLYAQALLDAANEQK